jgi:hypothetical protein
MRGLRAWRLPSLLRKILQHAGLRLPGIPRQAMSDTANDIISIVVLAICITLIFWLWANANDE